jgi:heptosyltransferase-1
MTARRVLIIRLSAIGDIVMASALVPALRRAWPDAYLAWLCEPAGAELLRPNPRIDEVIVWPRGEWRRLVRDRAYRALARAIRDFVRGLRGRRFDLVLDTQGLLKSGVWARLTGAPRRVGLGSRESSQHLMTETLSRRTGSRRIGAEYLALAQHLGLDVGTFPMDVPVSEAGARRAGALLAGSGVAGPYAVLCPFTTRPQKHWLEDRWVGLVARVHRDLDLLPVFLGGPEDRAAADRLVEATGGLARHLAGETHLDDAAAVVRGARLLVGVDTGLTHLGIAEDVPTVALFGSTCPYLDPATPRARVLYEPLPCSPCRRHPTCQGRIDCMRLHTVERVLEAAQGLLETPP